MKDLGLTKDEQANVRAALHFLRRRVNGWAVLGKAIHFTEDTLSAVGRGAKPATPSLVFKLARFAKVGVDELLAGRFPAPGTCPYCGHTKTEEPDVVA